MHDLKERVTILIVTHNMQQAPAAFPTLRPTCISATGSSSA